MSVDQLWSIHQGLGEILAEKIASELDELRRRLASLEPQRHLGRSDFKKRPYGESSAEISKP